MTQAPPPADLKMQRSSRDAARVPEVLEGWLSSLLPEHAEPEVVLHSGIDSNGMSSETLVLDATWTEGGDFQVRGDYVLVFTDETYLHQNHSPLTSWVDETREVGKTSSKGKRLIVLHAVTMDGVVIKGRRRSARGRGYIFTL